MNFVEYLAWTVLAVLGLYVAARVISAAYFRSKQDHELRKQHDRPQTNKP